MSEVFLAIGECMVEMAPRPDGAFTLGFAGDSFNTAWYARRLFPQSWQVEYLTGLGDDAISQRMRNFMHEAGIGTQHTRVIAGKTVGLYMIELREGERSFSYWRSDSAARRLAADRNALGQALEVASLAYFSGITLAILPPEDRQTLLLALAAARARGTRIVFDPNLRPRLWPSLPTMRGEITRAARQSDIVLPSHDDEAVHFGDADPEATIRRYADLGVSTVVVKNGAGRMLCLADGRLHAADPVPVGDIVDTTAAGDSFNAGFLAALLADATPETALRRGSAIAGQVIGARGALVEPPAGGYPV